MPFYSIDRENLYVLIYDIFLELITKNKFSELKILFLLKREVLIKSDGYEYLFAFELDDFLKIADMSSDVFFKALKSLNEKLLVYENKKEDRVDNARLFSHLTIYPKKKIVEIWMKESQYNIFLTIAEEFLQIDFANTFRLKNENSIIMLNKLTSNPYDRIYTIEELNTLFRTDISSFKIFEKRILIPIKEELDKLSEHSFSSEIKKEKVNGRARDVSFLILYNFKKIKRRKSKKSDDFLAWIKELNSVRLDRVFLTVKEERENLKWQDRIKSNINRLAIYLGF